MSPREGTKAGVSDAPQTFANFTLERDGRQVILTFTRIAAFIDKQPPAFTGR